MNSLLLLFFALQWLTDAREVIRKSEETLRSKTNSGEARLSVVDPNWTRTIDLKFYERNRSERVIIIIAPAPRKNEATLRLGKNVWQYIPKWEKAIRIPPSSLGESWLGSDFTYQDLTFSDDWLEEYEQSIVERIEDKIPMYEIALTAEQEAPVQWLKIHALIRAEDFLPVRYDYYDEKGKVIRSMEFSNIQSFNGRKIPTVWKLQKVGSARYTELIIRTIQFDLPLSNRIFSLSFLEWKNR